MEVELFVVQLVDLRCEKRGKTVFDFVVPYSKSSEMSKFVSIAHQSHNHIMAKSSNGGTIFETWLQSIAGGAIGCLSYFSVGMSCRKWRKQFPKSLMYASLLEFVYSLSSAATCGIGFTIAHNTSRHIAVREAPVLKHNPKSVWDLILNLSEMKVLHFQNRLKVLVLNAILRTTWL